jgi:hypothetical protein
MTARLIWPRAVGATRRQRQRQRPFCSKPAAGNRCQTRAQHLFFSGLVSGPQGLHLAPPGLVRAKTEGLYR